MSHIQKMSEVQSIKANGIKVSLKHCYTRYVAVALSYGFSSVLIFLEW